MKFVAECRFWLWKNEDITEENYNDCKNREEKCFDPMGSTNSIFEIL